MSEPTVSKSQLFKPVILIRSRHTIVRGISSLGSHSITTSFISSLVNRATSKFNFFRRLVLSVSPSQWKSGWCVVDGENGKMIFHFLSAILSTIWSGESSSELEKLGETWWKAWLSLIIKLSRAWLSRPLIIRPRGDCFLPLIITISDTS